MKRSYIWRLKVSENFSAAHALRHYKGKCENLHGHNFCAEVCVEGPSLQTGVEFLLDFKALRNVLREVLAEFDHALLNEQGPFVKLNPTSENLARHIFQTLELRLEEKYGISNWGICVKSVTIAEKPGQSATYTWI